MPFALCIIPFELEALCVESADTFESFLPCSLYHGDPVLSLCFDTYCWALFLSQITCFRLFHLNKLCLFWSIFLPLVPIFGVTWSFWAAVKVILTVVHRSIYILEYTLCFHNFIDFIDFFPMLYKTLY